MSSRRRERGLTLAGRPEFLDVAVGADVTIGALAWPGLLGAPTVVAIPGAVQTAWWFDPLAHHLAGAARLVAVDLRGRGRSLGQPGPYGIEQHADDVVALIRWLDVGPVVVTGHAMGASVALMAAERHPDAVRELLLIDGGTPTGHEVDDPAALDAAVERALGAEIDQVHTVWPDRVSYQSEWSQSPAFADGIGPDLERNLLADLVEVDGGFRLAVDPEALLADGRDLLSNRAVSGLLERRRATTTVIRAEFGRDRSPTPSISPAQPRRFPQHRWIEATGLDHLTVVLSAEGAALVADTLRSLLVAD